MSAKGRRGTRERRRIAKGIYHDKYGLAATVKVNNVQREKRFPPDTPIKKMRPWQDETRASLRTRPKEARHTLAYDAPRYIELMGNQLVSIKDRERNLGHWVEKFGDIPSLELERHLSELNTQLHEWRKERSGATCNHRRDALMNLVRVLYGSKAASGLADLVTFPKPPPKPRWLERAHVADVLAKLEPGTKLAARLHLLHWTGIRPSQMGLLTRDDFHLNEDPPQVSVPRGKGGRNAVIPLIAEGVGAAREFIALEAFGAWKTEKANKALTKAALEAGRKRFTTYQIRHTFATALRQTGADVADIQKLCGHTNPKTTEIYAPANLKKQQEAIERVCRTEKAKRQIAEDAADISGTDRDVPFLVAISNQIEEGTDTTVSEAAAERLHTLYTDQLRQSLRPPVGPMVNAEQTRAMIRRAGGGAPGLYEEPDATTWIWSDLHLGHEESLAVFDRPFRTPDEMDQAMRHAWYELVGVDDVIICLGDVGVDSSIGVDHQAWWREAPGAKWLVVGNHDVDPVNQVVPVSVDRTAITLFTPGEPPLLLTHVPLLGVPAGCINVHGHVHGKESPSRNRHINVNVEQLNYRPARLRDVRRLALRLLQGRTVPGHRTRERLDIVESSMP